MIDESICRERHKRIDEKLDTHDKRLNTHSERLDFIEKTNSVLEERLDNLIKQLSQLNSTMRWFMGIMVGAFISFFFYAAQRGLIK